MLKSVIMQQRISKIHKKFMRIPKGRPIIAACGSNTERISWLLDNVAKDSVKKLDSFIEDTPDLLRKFEEINKNENLPPSAKPYSIDIKSFYTNILLNEGIEAFREELEKREDHSIPTEFLIKLLKLVMECNIFKFNNKFWIQLLGTSMGTRVAPTYANLFMGKLEKQMLENCPDQLKKFLYTWKRYIDDILVIWTGSDEEFKEIFSFLNSFHSTIKFDEPQHNPEDNSCDFLDMKISIENGNISTDLFRKETSKPRALLPSSAHPGHITTNIVYSMAFRLLRICSSEIKFEERLSELKNDFLIPRNYNSKVIDSQFKRIRNLPGQTYSEKRNLALEKKEKKKEEHKRITAPMDFNPNLPKLSGVLNKHFKSMMFKKPELKTVFKETPMASLRQPPNLRKMLCRAPLYQQKREDRFKRSCQNSSSGWKKCGKGSSTSCPFALPPTNTVTGQVTGYIHTIQDSVTCQTPNCVYYWKCIKTNCKNFPKCEYVGLTSRPYRNRLAEHKQYIKSKLVEKPSGFHFNQDGHNLSHFAGLVLENVKSNDPFVLRAREFLYIQKFDCYRNGLNKEP